MSAEIDRRLRQSFWDRDHQRAERDRVFGGRHNFTLAFLLARVATGVEHRWGASWRENAFAWRDVATAIVALLQLMQGLVGRPGEAPLQRDGRPNPAWGYPVVQHGVGDKEPPRDPHWFSTLREVEIMLENVIPLHWPFVATIKRAHDDFRDDMMPSAVELRELYAETGSTPEAV